MNRILPLGAIALGILAFATLMLVIAPAIHKTDGADARP